MQIKAKPVVMALAIPYPLWKAWYEYIDQQKKKSRRPNQTLNASNSSDSSDSNTSMDSHYRHWTYVDLLEFSIPGNMFLFSEESDIRSEVDESLRKIASSVKSEYRKAKGSTKKKQLNSMVRKFHIFEEMIRSVKELDIENESIKDEMELWKKNCKNLQDKLDNLYEDMISAINEKNEEIDGLQNRNKQLDEYIKCLEKDMKFSNHGKNVADVKKKSRTLKTFISRAKIALWFAESFGVKIESITVKEEKTGIKHSMITGSSQNTNPELCGINSLSNEERKKIEEILFLLDKFCVGDNFYHELSMVVDGLPKSYLIRQRRNQLNEICHVNPTPGTAEGAQLSFTHLLEERISDLVAQHPETDWTSQPIKIKISGDGVKMTRNTSFTLLSFSLLQNGNQVMSASGNHTIAIVKGSESYETIKESFETVFNEINNLINAKKIKVNNTEYNLEFFLGGDYKFLLTVMGMKCATSNYACIWCKVHKDNRWKMDFNLNKYNSAPLQRTLKEIIQMADKKGNDYKYSCQHKPLLEIVRSHYLG